MKKLQLKTPRYKQLENLYAEWLNLLGYSERTVYVLPIHLREFLHWLECLPAGRHGRGVTTIKQVTGKQAKEFIFQVSKRANQRQGGGLSNNHLNKYIQCLKLFSRYIRETGQGSYVLDMNMLKHERPYLDGTKEILTIREVQALYKACDYTPYTPLGLRDKAMLSIFYGCGLRRNEGVHLDLNDLLFDKQLVYVRKGKHYRERYVPMSKKVIEDVSNYLYEGRPYILQDRKCEALFISELGGRMQGQSLMVRLKRLRQKSDTSSLKDKGIGLHMLRHSIATHLLQAGMKLQDIAAFLGHKSLDSTQIYTHIKYGYL
jgi:integrase/recombinase XerD